jgi:hypothetical protein
MSPTSSRNRVPPETCSNLPIRLRSAPVNAPFSWPEQLALQELFRDGRAVQRQEGSLGAGAVLVDGAGDQLLAGAALAGDEYRHVLGGDAADRLVDLAHGKAGADDGPVHVGVRGGLGHHGRLPHLPGHLQRLADHAAELVRVERLAQVVGGALLHRLDGRVRRLRNGHEDDRDPGVDGPDLLVNCQPGLVGQVQVEENDIRGSGPDPLEPFGTGGSHLDPVSRRGERLAHLSRGQGRVVVDEQQMRHARLARVGSGLIRETDTFRAVDRSIPPGS